MHIVREKEIEKRVEEMLKEKRQETRDSHADEKKGIEFKDAADGLDMLSHNGVGALKDKVDYLKAILTVHGRKPVGNKVHLQEQIRKLLKHKTPEGTDQAAAMQQPHTRSTIGPSSLVRQQQQRQQLLHCSSWAQHRPKRWQGLLSLRFR